MSLFRFTVRAAIEQKDKYEMEYAVCEQCDTRMSINEVFYDSGKCCRCGSNNVVVISHVKKG